MKAKNTDVRFGHSEVMNVESLEALENEMMPLFKQWAQEEWDKKGNWNIKDEAEYMAWKVAYLRDEFIRQLEIITPEWSEVLERIKGLGSVYEITEHGSAWSVESQNVKPEHYLSPDYVGFSDYSGSSIDRANVQVFMEEFGECEGVINKHGCYRTEQVMIRLDCLTEEMLETLECLQDYPCLDDEAASMLEMEMEDRDWECWIEKDLNKALQNVVYNMDIDDDKKGELEDILFDADLNALYLELCERTGEYWHPDSATGGYVNVEKLAKACTIADIEGLKGETNE